MSVEFWELVQNGLEMLLTAALGTVIAVVGVQLRAWLVSKTSQARFETAVRLIRAAVLAAEQEGLGGIVADKKQVAIAYAQQLLDEAGIQLSAARIGEIIESLVYEELTRWQQVVEPPLAP